MLMKKSNYTSIQSQVVRQKAGSMPYCICPSSTCWLETSILTLDYHWVYPVEVDLICWHRSRRNCHGRMAELSSVTELGHYLKVCPGAATLRGQGVFGRSQWRTQWLHATLGQVSWGIAPDDGQADSGSDLTRSTLLPSLIIPPK